MVLVKEFKTSLLVLVSILLFFGLYLFYFPSKTPSVKDETLFIAKDIVAKGGIVVTITPNGFVPFEVTIKQGEKVVWLNESGVYAWPASDLHPTHGIYPEFDSLEPIPDGQAWVFTFDKAGAWQFHDHLKPNRRGLVRVE
ncbi:hypothetical protein A2818_00870 [Candidatus Nomurabacteria bacterium RIFCSPHIGHO2_01_FULL_40_12]|uniref:EfeO-type cupredoxin-like domain-containing protein n=1 Tax=Candidatus Nomurabacteria bacterium RIFCSPHIGHO2_01_FULL_40_12 TaxID=1801737 RepID=A0A1F6UZH9_9BACT|nr:MAG: hypothetical protein A2818_00870 [Candidatus Nomurabacteria bacterium RIFCSPHIGHO2_01_FULL_40_12]